LSNFSGEDLSTATVGDLSTSTPGGEESKKDSGLMITRTNAYLILLSFIIPFIHIKW
jgi:hypothetical protein